MSGNGNPTPKKRNPNSLANLRPPFNGQPGPGRPPLPPEVKAERKEAREILKNAAPRFAQRIVELSESRDDHTAIAALKVGLDKVLPNLEEVENFEHRPLQQLTDEQIDAKLAEINTRRTSTPIREGEAA